MNVRFRNHKNVWTVCIFLYFAYVFTYQLNGLFEMSTKPSIWIASLLFGLSSWIAISGLWLELPILIQRLPEKWGLASQLTFAIQFANITVFVFCALKQISSTLFNDVSATNFQLSLGVLACVSLIFGWDHQIWILGTNRSVILLVSTFCLAIIDCLSSVTFLPFVGRFRAVYLIPFLIGEGFSGFLAILFAIIQNGDFNAISEDETNQSLINQNLRFSPSIFFISLLTTILLSWSAFVYLLFSRNAQAELIERSKVNQKSSICTVCCGWNVREDDLKRTKSSNKSENNIESISRHLSSFESISHQVLILICCIIMFGVLPAIQPYACLPLGRFVLNYSVLLTSLAYPLGCAIALKRKCNRLSRLLFLFSIACLFVMFIFWMAVHSPKLPSIINGAINQTYVNSSNKSLSVFEVRYKILKSLKKVATTESNLSFYWRFSLSGDRLRIGVSIFMILSWFLSTLIFSYVRTMITVILNKHKGSQGLFRIGIYTQIGSIAGAAFMFVAVNHFKWFKQTA